MVTIEEHPFDAGTQAFIDADATTIRDIVVGWQSFRGQSFNQHFVGGITQSLSFLRKRPKVCSVDNANAKSYEVY